MTNSTWIPVRAMELHDLFLQFLGLVRDKSELLGVVRAVDFGVVFPQLRLQSVRTQQGQSDKRAGQTTTHDVLTQLETHVIPADHRAWM